VVTIITRAGKGAPLTNTEVDDNFTNLNTGKVETSAVGTIAAQDANNVAITGGSITGITDLAVADGGTGASSLVAKNLLVGAGTSPVAFLAPGTADTVVKSDGTDWVAGSPYPSQTGNSGKVLGTDGSAVSWSSAVTLVASASATGTAIDFTVPSWVRRITVLFYDVSFSGSTSRVLVQLGTASGITTSGYASAAWAGGSGNTGFTSTTGFLIDGSSLSSADDRAGMLDICLLTGNSWVASGTMGRSPVDSTTVVSASAGRVALSAAVTTVRVTRSSTNTFTGGTIAVQYI
jgi:hypothetical protein